MSVEIPRGGFGTVSSWPLDNGKYLAQVRWRDFDGKYHLCKRTAPTKARAEARVREAIAQLPLTQSGARDPRTPLRVFVEKWRFQMEASDLAEGSKQRYREMLTIIDRDLGSQRVGEVTAGSAHRWLSGLGANVKQARTVLRQVIDVAVIEDVIPRNPTRDMPPVRTKRASERVGPRAATTADLLAWRSAMHRWRLTRPSKNASLPLEEYTLIAAGTGGRISEVLALAWMDIDLDAGWICLSPSLAEVRGVGLVRRHHTKTKSGDRMVRAPEVVMEMLRAKHEAASTAERGPLAPVLPSRSGTHIWPNNLRRAWNDAKRHAPRGYDLSWLTPHSLRDTAVTRVIEEMGPEAGSTFAGHSSLRVTEEHYWDKRPSVDIADAMETHLGDVWRRPIA